MTISFFLVILAVVLLIFGFIGTFVPVLPGAPLAWAGLLAAYFSSYCNISLIALIIAGIFAVLVSILDSFLPVIMTKKFGGSRAATAGATIGLIIGFFAGPLGMLFGPLIGAILGEFIHTGGKNEGVFKAAFGAFAGFLTGTGLKIICVLCFIWFFVIQFFR